jgi:hypothetical protein
LPIDQVIEALLRQLVRLTILPLTQIATLPGAMMRSPKRLALMFPSSMFARHSVISIFKFKTGIARL